MAIRVCRALGFWLTLAGHGFTLFTSGAIVVVAATVWNRTEVIDASFRCAAVLIDTAVTGGHASSVDTFFARETVKIAEALQWSRFADAADATGVRRTVVVVYTLGNRDTVAVLANGAWRASHIRTGVAPFASEIGTDFVDPAIVIGPTVANKKALVVDANFSCTAIDVGLTLPGVFTLATHTALAGWTVEVVDADRIVNTAAIETFEPRLTVIIGKAKGRIALAVGTDQIGRTIDIASARIGGDADIITTLFTGWAISVVATRIELAKPVDTLAAESTVGIVETLWSGTKLVNTHFTIWAVVAVKTLANEVTETVETLEARQTVVVVEALTVVWHALTVDAAFDR